MKPELDYWSIVELIDLSSHRDEAVAALDLWKDILLPGCLRGYLTQHCLSQTGDPTQSNRVENDGMWGKGDGLDQQ